MGRTATCASPRRLPNFFSSRRETYKRLPNLVTRSRTTSSPTRQPLVAHLKQQEADTPLPGRERPAWASVSSSSSSSSGVADAGVVFFLSRVGRIEDSLV